MDQDSRSWVEQGLATPKLGLLAASAAASKHVEVSTLLDVDDGAEDEEEDMLDTVASRGAPVVADPILAIIQQQRSC